MRQAHTEETGLKRKLIRFRGRWSAVVNQVTIKGCIFGKFPALVFIISTICQLESYCWNTKWFWFIPAVSASNHFKAEEIIFNFLYGGVDFRIYEFKFIIILSNCIILLPHHVPNLWRETYVSEVLFDSCAIIYFTKLMKIS